MEAISNLFSSKFSDTLSAIAEKDHLVQQFKEAFDQLEPMFLQNFSLVSPIFVNLAEKSSKLCDWLISQRLLKLDEGKQARSQATRQKLLLLQELLNINHSEKVQKLEKLLEFIIL